jgi:hypothetical protein
VRSKKNEWTFINITATFWRWNNEEGRCYNEKSSQPTTSTGQNVERIIEIMKNVQ